ncbi:MAG: peptidoglycan binding domain-containing protein [Clostridiales bacterium]|nr:peptidoglycan binding domain-containing protein [Clostridiales bacterium]
MIRRKVPKLLILIGTIIIVLIFLVWQISWFISWQSSNFIFDGVEVNGIDIGGLDIESAQEKLNTHTKNELLDSSIELHYEDIYKSIALNEFLSYDTSERIHEAYSIGRTGNRFADYITMARSKLLGRQFELTPLIDLQRLEASLIQISDVYYIAPTDAYIVSFDPEAMLGNRMVIVNDIPGRSLDIISTAESIKNILLSGKDSVECIVSMESANITQEILQSIDSIPISSEYTIRDITAENESAILQIIGSGRHIIINPGAEISVINFLEGEEYIYYSMPDGGTKSDYEKALTNLIPTQIFIASVMSEVDITQRSLGILNKSDLPAGADTIINQYGDMIVKNNMELPIILRVGYKTQNTTSQIFCEIYRTPMENATILRSVIKPGDSNTRIKILRVYVDEKGNPINSVLIETIN